MHELGRELDDLDVTAAGGIPEPLRRHEHAPWSVARVAFLALSAICIYLFAPSIAEVFSAYDRLGQVHPIWLIPATLCAVGSFACVWFVQAVALGTRDWFSVALTQLAGNAFNRWVVRCMAAAGLKDLTTLDVLLLHHVNHRAREKKLADISFMMNIDDEVLRKAFWISDSRISPGTMKRT